jgi:hypothetical protein
MHDRVERIESVKAGSLSGIAAGMSYCLMMTVDRFLLGGYSRSLVGLGLEVSFTQCRLCLIAIITGFLFGVTYRYIIRTDQNNHLNSGAVLAFGLVRGLAQVDVAEFELAQIWMDGLIVSKSILLFSIARYTLDYALAASWVLPFVQASQSSSLNRMKILEDLPKHTAEIAKLDSPRRG